MIERWVSFTPRHGGGDVQWVNMALARKVFLVHGGSGTGIDMDNGATIVAREQPEHFLPSPPKEDPDPLLIAVDGTVVPLTPPANTAERQPRPERCRNRLRDEGKPHPKSGCAVCKTGGITGCPFEKGFIERLEYQISVAREAGSLYWLSPSEVLRLLEDCHAEIKRINAEWLDVETLAKRLGEQIFCFERARAKLRAGTIEARELQATIDLLRTCRNVLSRTGTSERDAL